MSNTKYKLSNRALAEKWCTTATTIRRYAKKGCNWDASDYEVAVWLITKCTIQKSSAMREAVYAVPGIRDGSNPEQPQPLGEIDCHAYGELMTLECELEAQVAELKEGDIGEALRLQAEVNKLDAMAARLRGGNRTS